MKIVRAIRDGRIVASKPFSKQKSSHFYDIWASQEPNHAHSHSTAAPKRRLPTNSESYNPPPEYLPTEEERQIWESTASEDRETDFLPQSYSALRHVPGYDNLIHEQFSRQLDLYLAPRIQRKKLNINADSLIPKLPSPSSLRPFPVYQGLRVCHQGRISCIATCPDGLWVVTGDDLGLICLWEIAIGCQVSQWKYPAKITAIAWCPRQDYSFFVIAWQVSISFTIKIKIK